MADTGTAHWVPALVIGGETTDRQRQRNRETLQRLRDGDGRGMLRGSGLAGFVFDEPIERLSVGPGGKTFSFRLDKGCESFRRLLSVIADHFPDRCDADDEVERLRARVAELEARLDARGTAQ